MASLIDLDLDQFPLKGGKVSIIIKNKKRYNKMDKCISKVNC
jgi:hypothetical protein